jgi:hypothetical protein
MKTTIRTLSIITLILSFSLTLTAQGKSKKEQKKKAKSEKRFENYTKTKELLESGNFVFSADRAFPTGMRSIDLTNNPGYIIFKNDSAEADLPFFGRSYSADYGGNTGIKFRGKIENKDLKYNDKKHRINYAFSVNDKDNFQISMIISDDGSTNITINSSKKNSISYNGKIEKPEDKKNDKK